MAMNNEHLNEKLQETFLSSLGNEHASQLIDHINTLKDQQDENEFPTSLDDWFDGYVNKMNRFKIMKRIAIVLIGLVVGTSMLSLNSDAFRTRLFNLFIKSTEVFSEVTYDNSIMNVDLENDLPADWTNYYYPTVLPVNYAITDAFDASNGKYLIFTDIDKQNLIFIQCTLDTKVLVDSEDAVSYAVDINGLQGTIFEKTDLATLIWADNANSFYLIGNVDKNTLVKIASTLTYKK